MDEGTQDGIHEIRQLGRYRLGEVIGRGGSGLVYGAVLEGPGGLEKQVALKLLHEGTDDLRREARISGLLRHRHLVDVFEIGREEGRWFMAMERCEDALSDHLPLPVAAVVEVGIAVAGALDYALGELGLLHLDIKPDNLLLSADGSVKVADLGIARARGFVDDRRIRGTPGFMAPEQVRGQSLDGRTDIYALGITLRTLSDSRWLATDATMDLGTLVNLEDGHTLDGFDDVLPAAQAVVIQDRAAGIPAELSTILDRCTAVHPNDRFASMSELADALRALRLPGVSLREHLGRGLEPEETLRGAGNLMPSSLPFVGRSRWLPVLMEALETERIAVLRGGVGVGKTRLAREASLDWRERRNGTAWLFDLTSAPDVATVYRVMAATLQLQLDDVDPRAQVGRALRVLGQTILVFDGVDAVSGIGEVLYEWCEQAPLARALVTTRGSVDLPYAKTLEVGVLEPEEAADLFVARALARGVVVARDASVFSLCETLDGLPLAIELAAGRLGVLTVDDLVERMGLGLLRSGESNRHATLKMALDQAWDLLTAVEREALQQLSVFEGGFSVSAVESVWSLGEGAASPIDVLHALVDGSWVYSKDGRLSLLRPVQLYVRERSVMLEAAERRHAAWFAQQESRNRLFDRGVSGVLVSRDLDNVRVAFERSRRAGRLGDAVSLFHLLWAMGKPTESMERLDTVGLELLNELGESRRWKAKLLPTLGWVQLRRGRTLRAAATLEEAIRLALESDDPESLVWARERLAVVRVVQGRFDGALDEVERAECLMEEHGFGRLRARICGTKGGILRHLGRLREAVAAYQTALRHLRSNGDALREAMVLGDFAILQHQRGDSLGAERSFLRSCEVFRKAKHVSALGHMLTNLGYLYAELERVTDAECAYEEAIPLLRMAGKVRIEGIARATLAQLHAIRGDYPSSAREYERAAATLEACGSMLHLGTALSDLGVVLHQCGDLPESEEAFDRAVTALESVDDCIRATAVARRARVQAEPEGVLARLAVVDQSIQVLSSSNRPKQLREVHAIRAELAALAGDGAASERSLRLARAGDLNVWCRIAVDRVPSFDVRGDST